MDTAIMKSWYEVVRRTDPFLWGLALEGPTSPAPGNDIDHLESLRLLQDLHDDHLLHPQHHQPLLPLTPFLSLSDGLADESILLHECRTMHDRHGWLLKNTDPQNAFAWLRCTTQVGRGCCRQSPSPTRKSPRTTLDVAWTDVELAELAKEAFPTRFGIRQTHHHCTQEITAQAPEALAKTWPPPLAGSHHHHHHTYHFALGSYLCPVWTRRMLLSGRVVHPGVREIGEGALATATTATTATPPPPVASSPSATTPSSSTPTPMPGVIVSASIAAMAVAAVETETRALNQLEVDHPIEASATTAPTNGASDNRPSFSSASSNSREVNMSAANAPPLVSTTTHSCHTTTTTTTTTTDPNTAVINAKATTDKSTSGGPNSSSASSITPTPTTTATATAAAAAAAAAVPTAPSSNKSSRLSLLVSSTSSPSAIIHSATDMVYDGLTRSVDATTAFFYRTFSPTYRVTRLYIDSWSNGSQRRGLGRIRNSVFRGDAFKLIKGSAVHMKKTWNQVLTAYRTKSVTTTTTTTTTTTSTTPATRTSLSTPTENATHIHNKKESSKDRSDKNENSSSSNGNDRGNDRGNDKSSSGTRP